MLSSIEKIENYIENCVEPFRTIPINRSPQSENVPAKCFFKMCLADILLDAVDCDDKYFKASLADSQLLKVIFC